MNLNSSNLPEIDRRLTPPTYDRTTLTPAVVHIGVGGFHRAHQAYYLHRLAADHGVTDWGIFGVGLREGDRAMAEALGGQDGLYNPRRATPGRAGRERGSRFDCGLPAGPRRSRSRDRAPGAP